MKPYVCEKGHENVIVNEQEIGQFHVVESECIKCGLHEVASKVREPFELPKEPAPAPKKRKGKKAE